MTNRRTHTYERCFIISHPRPLVAGGRQKIEHRSTEYRQRDDNRQTIEHI